MESETFRSRLLQLVQRSRKALRLYTTAGQQPGSSLERFQSELSASQVEEWRLANSDLLRKLTEASEAPNFRRSVFAVLGIRNEFQEMWRSAEAEMAREQAELELCAKQADFIRAAVLSVRLARTKARVQATQAAHHELSTLIRRSRITAIHGDAMDSVEAEDTIELLDEDVIESIEEAFVDESRFASAGGGGGAKVIPLRRR